MIEFELFPVVIDGAERRRRQAIYPPRHPSAAYYRAYRIANPEQGVATARRRAWRLAAAPGRATAEQLQARIDYYGGRCYLCGDEATTLDHVIPIFLGGSKWPSNLRPACSSCNAQKHTKSLGEFLAIRERVERHPDAQT